MRFCIVGCALFSLFASLSLAEVSGENASFPPDAFRRIETYAEQVRAWSGTPGITLAVTSADRTLHVATLGEADLKLGKAVSETTLFQIGSITKSFTALALLMLAEEGKVDLDEPISKSLPWFSVRSGYAAITPRHLLTHTSGIPTNRDDLPSTPYMAVAVREQIAAWPPGSRFLYSNVGYQILHVLLETVAEKPWAEVVQQRILDPLGMSTTEPGITYAIREKQAVGYIYEDGIRPAHRSRALAEAPFFEYTIGDGAIASTASDMAAYTRFLLRSGEDSESRIVSKRVFEQFIRPEVADDNGGGYGCGINVDRTDGGLVLSHSGGMVGFVAFMAADLKSGFGVVVLANGPSQLRSIAHYALEVLRAADQGLPLPELPPQMDPSVIDNAADYEGHFESPAREQLSIEARANSLWVGTGDRTVQLERNGTDSFYTLDPTLDRYFLRFQRNEAGQVITATHGPRWFANRHYDGPTEFETPSGWGAYLGRYHSSSLWFSGFSVFERKGELWVVTGGGGETTAGDETRLEPLGGGVFRPAGEPSPERIVFDEIIGSHAWRVSWSGHPFYRTGIH